MFICLIIENKKQNQIIILKTNRFQLLSFNVKHINVLAFIDFFLRVFSNFKSKIEKEKVKNSFVFRI